jgi:hypothetical protein
LPKALPEPFAVRSARVKGGLRIVATLQDLSARATLMDTFSGDLGQDPMLFNDRASLEVEIPRELRVAAVEVVSATRRGSDLKHRLVGFAVEERPGRRVLHAQVDFAADGFQRSAFRAKGSRIELFVQTR